ncbi:MAG: ArsR family transcriptional regulator [Candidatus Nitrosotenuis sp.]|nr:MAG: ArsR family transcriptional regulator [Candidatus Nitrosotenuis sp.]
MQIQIVGREVDDERKDAILEIMSDKYCRAIIESTMDTSKSAIQISIECEIPVSTIYRRLQNLCDSKLLGISGSITSEGKKHFLYQSKIRAMTSVFDGSGVKVEIVPNVKKITE